MRRAVVGCALAAVVAVLTACSSAGTPNGKTVTDVVTSPVDPIFVPTVYNPASTYAAHCAAPRVNVIDPDTGKPYPDVAGSVLWENFWLRSWTHQYYLWYGDVPDRDPSLDPTAIAYFETRKTPYVTASGNPKDRFHFTYATADWIALSENGNTPGYGADIELIATTPPREAVVAYTEPGSPAVSAGLARGAQILKVDGVDLVNDNTQTGVDTLNAGLFPAAVGQSHTFTVIDLNGTQREITLASVNVTTAPVQNAHAFTTAGGATLGYLLFNDHLATSELALYHAFAQLQSANISDLFLDIRYNGGGYLTIASEVAYMIAGGSNTQGKIFDKVRFNDQYATNIDPIAGGSNTPTPFTSTAQGYSLTSGTPLPQLNLTRVFVLTGAGTCSASEAIINGLRGIGVEVIQIGTQTCGKPYGFYPQDNCGTTYFSIQYQGNNNAGFGDYPDGFAPSYPAGNGGVLLPGCTVADDFSHALGDVNESRLAAAIFYRQNGACPATTGARAPQFAAQLRLSIRSEPGRALTPPEQPWRTNLLLGLPRRSRSR